MERPVCTGRSYECLHCYGTGIIDDEYSLSEGIYWSDDKTEVVDINKKWEY